MKESSKNSADAPREQRLVSLDALRGFDMFWIIGGAGIFSKLAVVASGSSHPERWKWLIWFADQLHHVQWHGFRLYDLIFPLFLFIAGVALPFSYAKRIERGDSKSRLAGHAVLRGLLLVLLGMIYNGLLQFNWSEMRYASCLGRIGLAWMFAALIALYAGWRGQLVATVVTLVGYWAELKFIPVPGFGAGDLEPGHTLTDYLDRRLLPGVLLNREAPELARDPEGLLSTIPAIGTALMGALTGEYLRYKGSSGSVKTLVMSGAGAICLVAAYFWNFNFPINKNLWSSSFVLQCAGLSLLLLSLFYFVIDVLRFQRWSFFFVVIGYNSILIYMASKMIDFNFTTKFLMGGVLAHSGKYELVWYYVSMVMIKWLLLYFLYRQRVSLRV